MATNVTKIVPKSRSEYLERSEVQGNERIIINATEYITPDGIAERVKAEAEKGQSVTFPLNDPGSVYNHRLHKKPSVTVMGVFYEGLKEIICDIEYVDNDSIKVNFVPWDNWAGYVYIN